MLLIVCFLVATLMLLCYFVFGHTKTNVVLAFDVYVINLERAPKRMHDFVQRLRETDMSNVSPIRLAAVDGRFLNLSDVVTGSALQEIERAEKLGYRQRHYELTRGAVGCYLSHQQAWQSLLESDKNMSMICEDDAVLDSQAGSKILEALARQPPEWDILLLGYWCVKCGTGRHWKRMGRFFGLHCYLINRSAVPKISSYCGNRIGQQVDSMLSDMAFEGRLNVFGVQEKLAFQQGVESSVQMPLKPITDVDPWMSLPAVRLEQHTSS